MISLPIFSNDIERKIYHRILISHKTKIYENTLSNIGYYIARKISILIYIVSFIFFFRVFFKKTVFILLKFEIYLYRDFHEISSDKRRSGCVVSRNQKRETSHDSAAKDYPRNLTSVGTYPDLKGQVILCRLTNLSETSGEEWGTPKICFSDWTSPRTQGDGE